MKRSLAGTDPREVRKTRHSDIYARRMIKITEITFKANGTQIALTIDRCGMSLNAKSKPALMKAQS